MAGVRSAVRKCPHGYKSPASCVDCMQEGPVVEPRSSAEVLAQGQEFIDGFIFQAEYEGHCRECDSAIELGEPLYRMRKGEYVYYIHTGCIS